MNALSRLAVLEVLGRIWLDGDDNAPPTLELRLSNGTYVKVGFDTTHWHRLLWWAPDGESDFVTCTAERTGLDPGDLENYCDEVERACRQHAQQQDEESGAFESDEWTRHGGGGR